MARTVDVAPAQPYHVTRGAAETVQAAKRRKDMGHPRYSKEEIAARGQAIYDQQIRPQVEPGQIGEYLVINIETGDYEVDEDDAAVSQRAYARFPGAPLFGMRIGYPAWGQIGLQGPAAAR
jgi:hypothetical protein